jgi:four helix bundle protein
MAKSIIQEKSYVFALKIIQLYRLMVGQNEYVLSRQLLKSATSIGANVEEALAGQSRADFLAKMSIASKEARETNYWLRLIRDSEIVAKSEVAEIFGASEELINILSSIVKTTALHKKSISQDKNHSVIQKLELN